LDSRIGDKLSVTPIVIVVLVDVVVKENKQYKLVAETTRNEIKIKDKTKINYLKQNVDFKGISFCVHCLGKNPTK